MYSKFVVIRKYRLTSDGDSRERGDIQYVLYVGKKSTPPYVFTLNKGRYTTKVDNGHGWSESTRKGRGGRSGP